jgi:hypothetical protein
MRVGVLRRPRPFIVAALACALALPSLAQLRPAHAAPANVSTTLHLGVHGPQDAMVGQSGVYTLSVTADPAGADAVPLEYSIAFSRAAISVASFTDPDATCVDFANDSDVGVVCEQDALAAGQTVMLAVTVNYIGVSNGALIPVQAKAANSDFSYGDAGVKIVPRPQPQPPAYYRPGAGLIPAVPALPLAAA